MCNGARWLSTDITLSQAGTRMSLKNSDANFMATSMVESATTAVLWRTVYIVNETW